jgi:uncharacterized membrane protein
MNSTLNERLQAWQDAGLLSGDQAQAIRAYEAQAAAPGRLNWPAILAVAFGALLLGAGILLFVAAHWEDMGPGARFASLAALVAGFHAAGGACGERWPRLATAFHGLGTLSLGAAVFLAGQVFNLQEHWPGGVLLWAAGAWAGYAIFRDWVHAALAALLTPLWIAGEWTEAARAGAFLLGGAGRVLTVGLLALASTYLSCRTRSDDGLARKALGWIGGLALIPAAIAVIASTWDPSWRAPVPMAPALAAAGWAVALGAPLLVAAALRRKAAWMDAVAVGWCLVLGHAAHGKLLIYAWCALGAVGLVAWGLHEARRERINLGVAGFALVLVFFYFSDVMGMLGRSLGLMGLGALFLLGGWWMERLRRRLNARIAGGRP